MSNDGFLLHPQDWDEAVALYIARQVGIPESNEQHWRAVRFIRSHWEKYGVAPGIHELCRNTGLRLNRIHELFPMGPARGACKIAGLPRPDGCV